MREEPGTRWSSATGGTQGRRKHWVSLACLAVLVAGSVAAAWTVRGLVGDQERPASGFVAHLPQLVVGVGLLLSFLVFAVVDTLLRRRDYALALVEERTAALRESVTSLEVAREDAASARDEAVEASRLKSQFLANMSHEIRTPLNGVIGMTGLLLDTALDAEQRELAETARRSGEALLEVLNDILDFSKIEAGRLELEISDFDLATVMDEAVELFSPQAHEKGIELVAFVDPELPPTVSGDPGRLRQVLTNLVSNALKFTARGEVVVTASPVPGSSSMVRFTVRDTGPGIPGQDHERLFESFSQADPSTTRHFGGTGLGLAIAKRLVEMMGGTIGLESTVGEGSTFWFTARLHHRPELAPRPVERGSLGGVRVLVVDDNATNRLILERQLSAWGMETVAAVDAAGALHVLLDAAAAGTLPHLAILDKELPGMDGAALGLVIAGRPELAGVRLVMLASAVSHPSAESPFAAVLTKPVRRAQLFEVVASVLGVDPSAVPPGAGRRSAGGSQAPGSAPAADGPRLLVAEDNPVNQRVAAAMLRRLGYRVDVVGDGREAIESVARVPYAAVLMDCQMPEMNGYQAAGEIRRREAAAGGGRVPIVALTAAAVKGDEEKCLAAGMDAYVTKPVRVEALADVLGRVVGRAQDGPGGDARDQAAGMEPSPPESGDPVLDPPTLLRLRRLGGGEGTVLRELAVLFREGAEEDLTNMRQALIGPDREALSRTAHRLRGSSTAMGATRLATLATELERRAGDGEDDLDGLVRAVERAVAEVDAALDVELANSQVA